MALSRDIYRELEDIVGPDNISEDLAVIDGYSYQRFGEVQVPREGDRFCPRAEAIVMPGSTKEVQAIIRLCNRRGLKSKASSTGYGPFNTLGGKGAILLDLRRMNRILDIDEKNMVVVVEPYVCFAQVQAEAMKRGLNTHIIGAGSTTSYLASFTAVGGNSTQGIVPGQSYTNAIERQPGQTAWQVFDSKYPKEAPYMGIGHGKITEATAEMQEIVNRLALKANTIEELGKKMGVPIPTFKATVARYNELARMGKDLDFGKRPDRLTTIDKPPYYAGKGGYELLVVMGGLNVNTRLQPLDKDWEVIPGLYVGGNVIGNRFAVDYPLICPGISHSMALTFGRLAGLNAATLET